jgi:SAM-dependent methyltransferase
MQDIQRQFGRQAGQYSASRSHAAGESLEAVRRLVGTGPYNRGLDVATGAGFTAFAIAPRCKQTLALDATPEMLREAIRIASEHGLDSVGFALGNAEALPFSNASFDLITCRSSAHHFANVGAFLREAARLLTVGGILVVSDPVSPEDESLVSFLDHVETLRDPTHVHDLRVSEWVGLMESAGLAIEQVEVVLTPQIFDDWVHRSGTSYDSIEKLRPLFSQPGPEIRAAFGVREEPDGIHFGWDTAVIRARKAVA